MVQILTFKEISWQMIRIEADAIQSAEHEMLSAPIRLITNQSKIRVTLKRRVRHTCLYLFKENWFTLSILMDKLEFSFFFTKTKLL